MSDQVVRRAGLTALLFLGVTVLVRFGRRLASSRNDKIGITPIPIP
jgi:hypothetical protein